MNSENEQIAPPSASLSSSSRTRTHPRRTKQGEGSSSSRDLPVPVPTEASAVEGGGANAAVTKKRHQGCNHYNAIPFVVLLIKDGKQILLYKARGTNATILPLGKKYGGGKTFTAKNLPQEVDFAIIYKGYTIVRISDADFDAYELDQPESDARKQFLEAILAERRLEGPTGDDIKIVLKAFKAGLQTPTTTGGDGVGENHQPNLQNEQLDPASTSSSSRTTHPRRVKQGEGSSSTSTSTTVGNNNRSALDDISNNVLHDNESLSDDDNGSDESVGSPFRSVEKSVTLLDKREESPPPDFPLDVELQKYDIRGNPVEDPMVVRLDKQSHHPLGTADDADEALVKSMVLELTRGGADSESIANCCILIHFLSRDLYEVIKKRLANYLSQYGQADKLHQAVGLSAKDYTLYLCSLLKEHQKSTLFLLDQLQLEHVVARENPCLAKKKLSLNRLRAALHFSNTEAEYKFLNSEKFVYNVTEDSRVPISEADTQMTIDEMNSLRLDDTPRNRFKQWSQPQHENEEIRGDDLWTVSRGNRYEYEQTKHAYDVSMESMDSEEFLRYCLDSFEALLKKTIFSVDGKNAIISKYEQRVKEFLEQTTN